MFKQIISLEVGNSKCLLNELKNLLRKKKLSWTVHRLHFINRLKYLHFFFLYLHVENDKQRHFISAQPRVNGNASNCV